ncbi:MAG: dephospho-CoA kinase [Deltaproteobacteria bacterium]|nr:dephospho-CoA kinase [Deltaproteobacteria bacterium]
MKRNTKVLCLTGNIGTGKSTVSWMFEELGIPTIDADKIAHEALAPHSPIWEQIFKHFGKSILLEDNVIDRSKLAKTIFDDPRERKFLESLIHPYVRNEISHRIASLVKQNQPFVMVEIPLLFEVGWESDFDAIIVITCSKENEIERCRNKFKLSREEALKRIDSQYPLQRKIDSADVIIENDGPLEETEVQVKRLYHEMVSGKFPSKN